MTRGDDARDDGLPVDDGAGEIVNDSYATCSADVVASRRLLVARDPTYRVFGWTLVVFVALAACSALGGAAIAAGESTLLRLTGYATIGLAALFAAVAAVVAYLGWQMLGNTVLAFRHALLTPGVIVSASPPRLLVHTNMGNDEDDAFDAGEADAPRPPARSAVKRIDPGPAFADARVGDRVTCVSSFGPGEVEGEWGDFVPRPLEWGTDDDALIADRTAKLGFAAYDELEALVAGGLRVDEDDKVVFIDEDDER